MVKLDRQSASRKPIVPWYDSEAVCLAMLILMFLVFLFGYSGLTLVRATPQYSDYSWAPIFLMTASGIIIGSTTIRLIRRYVTRRFK
jgi:hypothetical protein